MKGALFVWMVGKVFLKEKRGNVIMSFENVPLLPPSFSFFIVGEVSMVFLNNRIFSGWKSLFH